MSHHASRRSSGVNLDLGIWNWEFGMGNLEWNSEFQFPIPNSQFHLLSSHQLADESGGRFADGVLSRCRPHRRRAVGSARDVEGRLALLVLDVEPGAVA